MNNDKLNDSGDIRHDVEIYQARRASYGEGFSGGFSWGYVIGLIIGALVVLALMKEGVTWLR